MKLEIYSNAKRMMACDTAYCHYTAAVIRDMQDAGFTFKLDGKKATAKAVIAACKKGE